MFCLIILTIDQLSLDHLTLDQRLSRQMKASSDCCIDIPLSLDHPNNVFYFLNNVPSITVQ